jgi:hypothetical protein
MMLAEIATALKADLDAVPDVGVTFDTQPLPQNDWAAFIRAFTCEIAGKREVRAWSIAYTGERRAYRNAGYSKVIREATFVVRGHLSMNATSDAVFRALVETVATQIDRDPSLGGTCIDHDACDVSIPDNGAGLFLGDVLCHYAEISVVARFEQSL